MNPRMRSFLLSLLLLVTATASHAGPPRPDVTGTVAPPPVIGTPLEGEARTAAIQSIEAYLTSIGSIVADFTQESADGSSGSGKFFLKRPGKMRWQYNPPTPILLVSDGKVITYYDAGLDQVTYVGIDDTLAGFLTRREIKLESDSTKITALTRTEDGLLRVTLIQRKKPEDGSLTLELAEKPMNLVHMIAVDATGNATTVSLAKAQFGPVLDDKLFTFEDPRGVNRKRNRR